MLFSPNAWSMGRVPEGRGWMGRGGPRAGVGMPKAAGGRGQGLSMAVYLVCGWAVPFEELAVASRVIPSHQGSS